MAVACLILTQPLNGVQAATPTFSPVAGTYKNTQSVAIACALPANASIYYTVDGTTPTFPITGTTQLYTSAITVSSAETLEAIAASPGYTQSGQGNATYAFQVGTPTFSPVAGTYNNTQSVSINDVTLGAVIYYTVDGSMPSPGSFSTLLQLPSYPDLFGITYVSGASGTSNGQTGSKPVNVPAGQIYMLAENANPNPAVSNGFYLPNTWDAHNFTGFKPVNAGGHAQLSYAGTGTSPTSTMQWEGQQVGVLLLGSEMAASSVRPQFTPQINFTNTPGTGNPVFPNSLSSLTESLVISCTTYVGSGNPETPANSPYISVNLGLCLANPAWELIIQINVLAGAGPNVSTGYVAQALPAYQLKIPINAPIAASSNLLTFTSGTYQGGTFGPMTVSWTISFAQMQNILNFMAAQGFGANPAFPSGLTPDQLTLNQAHINAEMPNVNTISLGWSMSNWVVTTGSPIYSAPISIASPTTINAIGTKALYAQSGQGTAAYAFQTATPVITPPTGNYSSVQSVTITCATTGSSIFYTTNGSTPTAPPTGGTQTYSGPFSSASSGSETVQAIASNPGYTNSAVQSVSYTINVPVTATPAILPASGTYTGNQTVSITDATSGSTIYYTTNGSTPTTGSTVYSGQFSTSGTPPYTETVQAIATASGHTQSATASQTYTINSGAGAPGAPTNVQLLFQGMNAAGNGISGSPPVAQNQNTQAIGWTQGTTGSFPITGTRIYRSLNGAAYAKIYDGAVITSYTDTAATTCVNGSSATANSTGQFWPANGYLYQVTAVDNQGTESARSATQIFTMYKNGQVADTNGVLRIGYGFYDDVNTGGTTVNYSATGQSPPFGDTKCIAITGPAFFDLLMNTGNNCVRWNMWVGATSPAQVLQYLNISFKPSQANQTYNIWIEFRTAQNTDPLSGTPPYNTPGVTGVGSAAAVYGPQQQNGVWASYKIPLSALMQSTSSVGNPVQGMFYKLAISNQTNNSTTFYVDNIWLSNS